MLRKRTKVFNIKYSMEFVKLESVMSFPALVGKLNHWVSESRDPWDTPCEQTWYRIQKPPTVSNHCIIIFGYFYGVKSYSDPYRRDRCTSFVIDSPTPTLPLFVIEPFLSSVHFRIRRSLQTSLNII